MNKGGRGNISNCINRTYARLTVVDQYYIRRGESNQNRKMLKCVCECGNITHAMAAHVIGGKTKSCGCINVEKSRLRFAIADTMTADIYEFCKNLVHPSLWKLTKQQFTMIMAVNCTICDRENKINQLHIVKRKNNQLPFIYDNCYSICSECNSI